MPESRIPPAPPPPRLQDLPTELHLRICDLLPTARDVRSFERVLWPHQGHPELWNRFAQRLHPGLVLRPPAGPRFSHYFKDGAHPKALRRTPGAAVGGALDAALRFAPRAPLTGQLVELLEARHAALERLTTKAVAVGAFGGAALTGFWRARLQNARTRLDPSVVLRQAHDTMCALPINLMRLFVDTGDAAHRWAVLDLLVDYGGPDATGLDLATACLSDPNPDIRKMACVTLGHWYYSGRPGGREAASCLAAHAACEPNAGVQAAAAWPTAPDPIRAQAIGRELRAWTWRVADAYTLAERYSRWHLAEILRRGGP
jgi:hypothetical protein